MRVALSLVYLALWPHLSLTEYSSDSGVHKLYVSPAGEDRATYVLQSEGKVTWSKELPFMISQAVVSNDGTVAGYAYTNTRECMLDAGYGHFECIVLHPTGKVLLYETLARTSNRVSHSGAYPSVQGIILLEGSVVFRIRERLLSNSGESWWVYSLEEGDPVARFFPIAVLRGAGLVTPKGLSPSAVLPLPESSLVLARFEQEDADDPSAEDVMFAVFSSQGRLLWASSWHTFEADAQVEVVDKGFRITAEEDSVHITHDRGRWIVSD